MANYYIDPDTGSGSGVGSEADPYAAWSEATIASNNNYYQKAGTELLLSSRIDINSLSNVTVGSYGTGIEPKIKFYSTLTLTGDFFEVQADNVTPVVSAGDTNVWKYDTGDEFWNPHIILGLGSLGDRNGSSFTNRVNYLGAATGSTTFTEFGQWDRNLGAVSDPASLYIYADENPITKWGTIYYTRGNNACIRILNNSSNITIENLNIMYGYQCVLINANNGNTLDNALVKNCIMEHGYDGINTGVQGTLSNVKILDNVFYVCGDTSIKFAAEYGVGCRISRNKAYNTGVLEGIGAFYGRAHGVASDPLVLSYNEVYTVIEGLHWNHEGYGLYSESSSTNVIWHNNYVEGCADKAGIHFNGGCLNVHAYANVVKDCKEMFNGSDSSPEETDDYSLCNNIGINLLQGISCGRPSSNGTATIRFYNNILISDGNGGNGINVDNDLDDMTPGLMEDNNCVYGFANTKVRNGGGALVNAFGVNNITSDPLLDADYYPHLDSPCIGAGSWTGSMMLDYGNRPFKRSKPSIGAWEIANRDPTNRTARE